MVTTVDVRGVPHAYEITGPSSSSTTLVFLHGWLLSRAYWRPTIQQLATEYQCLSYDLRGFGDSQPPARSPSTHPLLETASTSVSAPVTAGAVMLRSEASRSLSGRDRPPGYTPADYAQDLVLLLEQLHLANVWLVGHSLGGSIALWAADLMPERVKGVICINSGGGIYLKEEFEKFRAAGQQLIKLRPRWLCYLPLLDVMLTWLNVAHPIARSWGRQRLLDLVTANREAALGALLESTTEAEVHALPQVVARLQQPVYFVAGANDTVMEPKYVRHLASFHHSFQYRGDNVIEIPDCGHLAMVEHPETVTHHIQQILSHGGTSCHP
ncbi:MAG TPA: alpha/beta hydrolase [Synechococcales cyanobacterium M55_K2018_004]|nr:alpha/beta hydrolase [Synechococcales cyanobacterium M55_K2018_004]